VVVAGDADVSDRIYGLHAVEALLASDPERVQKLYVLDGRTDARVAAILERAEGAGIACERRNRRALDRLVDGGRHQGVVALCESTVLGSEAELELRWTTLAAPQLLLVLDGVMDPRNLGACLRSADAAGVQAVLLPRHRSAPLSEVARKTASGAAESLFVVEVANLARRLEWLKAQGVWVIGAAGDADSPFTALDYRKPVALVVGGEGAGMRPLTRATCDELAAIPMHGAVASLNVSVATGILLFEILRQRP
jgi:23S rRNA (guanosine2251-2'-O)-methyltransferase